MKKNIFALILFVAWCPELIGYTVFPTKENTLKQCERDYPENDHTIVGLAGGMIQMFAKKDTNSDGHCYREPACEVKQIAYLRGGAVISLKDDSTKSTKEIEAVVSNADFPRPNPITYQLSVTKLDSGEAKPMAVTCAKLVDECYTFLNKTAKNLINKNNCETGSSAMGLQETIYPVFEAWGSRERENQLVRYLNDLIKGQQGKRLEIEVKYEQEPRKDSAGFTGYAVASWARRNSEPWKKVGSLIFTLRRQPLLRPKDAPERIQEDEFALQSKAEELAVSAEKAKATGPIAINDKGEETGQMTDSNGKAMRPSKFVFIPVPGKCFQISGAPIKPDYECMNVWRVGPWDLLMREKRRNGGGG